MRKIFVSLGGGLVALCALMLLSGCETTTGGTGGGGMGGTNQAPKISMEKQWEYLRVGEQVTIEFLDLNPGQAMTLTVPEDGNVTLLLNQKINVLNKNVTQLQNEIHDIYVPKLYKRLTVNIKRETHFVYVLGEVKMAGRFPHAGDMTVLKAIAAAGGFTVYADKKAVEITRSNGQVEKMNAEKARRDPKKYDLPLYPDDRVNVPLRFY